MPDTSQLEVQETDCHPVGVGPEYEEARAAARKLLPLFGSHDNGSVGSWGCGLIDILEPSEEGHSARIVYPVASRWEKSSNSIVRTVDIAEIRSTGLALLAYAEAADRAAAFRANAGLTESNAHQAEET